MRQGFLVILFLLCILQDRGILTAQWRGPILTPLGPTEGLSAVIHRIVTDSSGYIYIASTVGLYRYDGHEFTFYGPDPLNENSIGAGEILNMIAGRDGMIWMALRFGGLNSFDPKTGIFKRYPLPELSFRTIPSATSLYEDSDGTIWVGATHFRLLAFDREKEQFTLHMPEWIDPEKHRGRLSILSITPDPRHADTLWLSVLDHKAKEAITQSFGLVIFRKSTRTFTQTPFSGVIRSVDSDGVMWGTQWGNHIVRFDPVAMQMDTFQHHFMHEGQDLMPLTRDIKMYKNKIIVASSLALMEFDTGVFSTFLTQDLTGEMYCLFVDPSENLWIGNNQGAQVLNPDDQHFRYFSLDQFGMYKRLFPGRLAYDGEEDVIYLSHTQDLKSNGFYHIPLNKERSKDASYVPTTFPVQGMTIDQHRKLWMVGGGSMYSMDLRSDDHSKPFLYQSGEKPLPDIMAMETNESGWIGMIGSREFVWFHQDSMKIKRLVIDQLPGSSYAKSFDNGFDGFSFSTRHTAYLFSNEVHRVDLRTGLARVLKYDRKVNPYTQRIQFVVEDQQGYIWMSTFVHTGKYQLKEDSLILIETFGMHQGMISAGAAELHIDHLGRVWVFTNSGLNAIDPQTGEIRFFGTKEGLPFPYLDPRQVLSIGGGRIATVCHNGLIVYNADDLWKSAATENVPVVFKRMRINGQDISSGVSANYIHTITLKTDDRGFDIAFQALVYPTDYKMEYSYRIVGLQEKWISIGRNQLITLPSLGPGQYVFEIKAGNPLSQAPVKSLQIYVPTPFYQKMWFILLVITAVIVSIFTIIKWRIRRIKDQEAKRTEINKQMAELELKALRSQMNPHFMFNSLNSIKNYILHAEPKLAAEYLSNFAHLIRMILQNSREKAITLQEELETLILYIELEQIRFDNRFEFNCIVEDGLSLEQIMIPPMLLQPFIENAIWHGLMHKKEKGHLLLRFTKEGEMVACIIEDDGVGRSKAAEMKSLSANKYKSMGMGITRDRIEIMNKMDALGITTEVIDKQDTAGKPSGTKIIVRIPGPALT